MKVNIYTVGYQVYLVPYLKITHDRVLHGRYEVIFGWWNREIVISW